VTDGRVSIIGRLSHMPVLREPGRRRIVFTILVALCALLTLFPQRQRAAMSLTPETPPSFPLSTGFNFGSTMGQMSGGLSSVFGNQSSIEISLKMAGSAYVRNRVADRLHLDARLGMSRIRVLRWLDRKVDVQSLRGSILEIEIKLSDGALGREIVAAYGDALRDQLAGIGRKQTISKRDVLIKLVEEASSQVEKAQADYDAFRLRTRSSAPQASVSAFGERIPMLEQMIRSKQVDLAAQRQFATDQNMRVRQLLTELEALRAQLAEAKSTAPEASASEPSASVGSVVRESTQGERLRRDLAFAQLLYDSYSRFLQSASADEMTSNINARVLEPAYIDPARQYNKIPLVLGVLVLLLGLAIEFYNLRPPVQHRVPA
jgi:uncharacterized protein involved in exopolysaccharide biosynthesis